MGRAHLGTSLSRLVVKVEMQSAFAHGKTASGALLIAALAALAMPAGSAADEGLILRRTILQPGELMIVFGGCRRPIYLVPESFARRTGLLFFSIPASRPPKRFPFVFLGRTRCTTRVHYVGHFPDGDWSSWSGYLRFRVPRVRPGRYQLVVYCAPCRRGPGGSLIVSTWLWRGSTRIGPTGVMVRRG